MVATITVDNDSYTDAAGNLGSGNTDAIIVDTVNPTLAIAFTESALSDGETSGVTFTFSEAPSDFVIGDINSPNGTMTNLVQDATNGKSGLRRLHPMITLMVARQSRLITTVTPMPRATQR
ncbi:hypothetical protein FR932_02695 [Moritella marina ATCC 15381]|uniref:Bacterial Ig-like domain-containing protein n=1 Tax=Moritella marina ATCC 15381 TaxID=1202962 RepID=A0A5J6WFU6_MORMI|nr:Ig-like domain-containing protein [Moritella marina]QFI36819.1 hypothetical protein FR932_02695 [Moritella marina ATCC 15381]